MSEEAASRSSSTTAEGLDASAQREAVRNRAAAELAAREASVQVKQGSSWWWVSLLLSGAAVVVGWWTTFVWMWNRWYPAWVQQDWSLHDRMTKGDSYYSHGPLVLLASLVVAFFIYRRVGLPARRTRVSMFLGAMVFGASVLAHLMSVYARVGFLSGFALIGVMAGLLLLWGGGSLLRAYWLPVVFLVFMVPLPEVMIADINFQLKMIEGRAALWLTNNVFNVRAVMSGSFVYIENPVAGGRDLQLVVDNVCSGLRSLIALIWFASLFAMVCRAKGPWRLFMLAMAAPVAIGCNVVRITMLNVVAYYYGVEAATEGSPAHDMGGLLVFGLALGFLFGLDQLIVSAGRWVRRDWSDDRLLGFLEGVSRVSRAASLRAAPVATAALVLSAALSVVWASAAPAVNRSDVARRAVPMELTVGGQTLRGVDDELDEQSLTILETHDYLYRHFISRDQSYGLDLLIVFSADNRKGTHPPEVCLEGGGGRVVSKREHVIDVPEVGPVKLRELIVEERGFKTLYAYVYKCGNSYTPSFFRQQATIFWNGMTARNSAGALIRFSSPIGREGDAQAVRQQVLAAAPLLMREIDRNLP